MGLLRLANVSPRDRPPACERVRSQGIPCKAWGTGCVRAYPPRIHASLSVSLLSGLKLPCAGLRGERNPPAARKGNHQGYSKTLVIFTGLCGGIKCHTNGSDAASCVSESGWKELESGDRVHVAFSSRRPWGAEGRSRPRGAAGDAFHVMWRCGARNPTASP